MAAMSDIKGRLKAIMPEVYVPMTKLNEEVLTLHVLHCFDVTSWATPLHYLVHILSVAKTCNIIKTYPLANS